MRFSLVLAIILTFLVPAANAISMSVIGGNGNAAVGATMTYESTLKDKVQQNIKLQPASSSMENSWIFSGPCSTKRTETGAWAGHAESGFSVTGANAYTIYDFASLAYPYAITAETLTSYGANDIYCYGYGQSASGDYAYVHTEVYDPNGYAQLYGYSNTAIGAQYFADASQSIGQYGYAYAPYGVTSNYEYAANRHGDVSYAYDYQLAPGLQYTLNIPGTGFDTVAFANDDYSIAMNSMVGMAGSYNYALTSAKPSTLDAVIDSKNTAGGWNWLYQDAYTYRYISSGVTTFATYSWNGYY